MKWEQAEINGKPQLEGIQCGEYRIGRFNGRTYGAWYRYERLGYYTDPADAKAACLQHLLSLPRVNTRDG